MRVAFILGNLTSRDEEARTKYLHEKYSIKTLIDILQSYFTNDVQVTHKEFLSYRSNTELENINENEPTPNEDVMIKVIRFIANLAINEDAGKKNLFNKSFQKIFSPYKYISNIKGFELANTKDLIDVLLSILGIYFY